MWFAGIDWADQHHDVVVIDDAGHRVGHLRVSHSAEGVAHLIAWLRQVGDVAQCPDQLACIIERPQGVLITALLEHGLYVYPVNPKTVDRSRSAAGAKTDAIDALILARKGRSDLPDLRRLQPDAPLIAELKTLTRDQDTLIQTQTRLVNQLIACLKAYYPVALTWFDKVAQRVTLAMLDAFPSPAVLHAATVAEIAAVLHAVHYSHADAKAQRLWDAGHAPQLQADSVTVRAKTRYMLALVAQLRLVMTQIAEYDALIAEVFVTHPDHELFAGLPGSGPRLAPRLLAEWGDDRSRYPTAASIQALAGTAPVLFQSGTYTKARARMACSKPLRNAVYQWARGSIQREPWAKAYYDRKRQQGKTFAMTVRALANHWLRILHAIWTKRERYQPEIFLQAQHAHGMMAA